MTALPPMLFADDVATIAPDTMLTGAVIFFALRTLTASRTNSIVLNPDLVRFSMDRDATALAELKALVASAVPAQGQVFIPVQVNNGHYVLAVAHFAARTIKFYDSTQPASASAIRVVARIIKPSAMGKAPWDRQFYSCPRQMNGADCGVSVFLTSMHLLRDPDATDLAGMPDMPAVSQSMYWLAGRTAILECCRVAAMGMLDNAHRVLARVQQRLDAAVDTAKRLQDHQARADQYQVLTKVSIEIAALNDDGDLHGAAEALTCLDERFTS